MCGYFGIVCKPMRKSKLYISLLILMISNLINGQSLIGIYGGLNSSVFFDKSSTPHYSANYETKNTYLIGLQLKERKNNLLNLTVGFDYLYRNTKIKAHYGGLGSWINRDLDVDIYSLNLRILPEIKIGKRFGFYFNIGPYFGFIIKSQKTGSGSSGDVLGNHASWIESGSAKDVFNGLDFGISSSLGLEIPLTNKFFFLSDINYGIGLSKISRGSLGSYAENINSRNFYITISVVYKIDKFSLTELIKKYNR